MKCEMTKQWRGKENKMKLHLIQTKPTGLQRVNKTIDIAEITKI